MTSNVFQPTISNPSPSGGGGRAVNPSSSLSGLANVANAFFSNKQAAAKHQADLKRRELLDARAARSEDRAVRKGEREEYRFGKEVNNDSKEAIANRALSDNRQKLIDLEAERAAGESLLKRVRGYAPDVSRMYADGVIDEDEAKALIPYEDALKKLQTAYESGSLNSSVYKTRRASIEREALGDPRLDGFQKEVQSLFKPAADSGVSPETEKGLQFNGYMDNKYGIGNWGAKEYSRELFRQQEQESLARGLELGIGDANRISALVTEYLGLQTEAPDEALAIVLDEQGGVLNPDQLHTALTNNGLFRKRALQGLNDQIQKSIAAGNSISIDDQKKLRQQVTDYFNNRKANLERTDLQTYLTAQNDLRNEYLDRRIPGGLALANTVGSYAGLGGFNGLLTISRDPQLRGRVEGLVARDLEVYGFSNLDEYLAHTLKEIATPFEDKSLVNKKAMEVVANTFIATDSLVHTGKQGSANQGTEGNQVDQNFTHSVIGTALTIQTERLKENPRVNSEVILRNATNTKYTASFVASATPEQLKMFKDNIYRSAEVYMGFHIQKFDHDDKIPYIYSKEKEEFVSTTAPDGVQPGFGSDKFDKTASATRIEDGGASYLNLILKAFDNPTLSVLGFNRQDVIDAFEINLQKHREAVKKAKEAEEAKKAKESKEETERLKESKTPLL